MKDILALAETKATGNVTENYRFMLGQYQVYLQQYSQQ